MLAKNKNNKNKGQVLVLVALSIFAFFGLAALAIDVGYFYHTKNQLQGAADAAALAGAAWLTCENDDLEQEDARREAWKYACKNKAAGLKVYLDTKDGENCDVPPEADELNNGDIVIGLWTGTAFKSYSTPVNAIQVRAHRTRTGGDAITTGMPKVSTFFGRIFGINEVNISATAVSQGCLALAPISVNEYWVGDAGFGGGGGDCKNPAKPNKRREPYGIHHIYPNSFVRPPSGTNGNVGSIDISPDCDNTPITGQIKANGPLGVPCSTPDECKGRPAGKPSAGRVFAIVGGNAMPNEGANMYSLLNLDERIGCSKGSPACSPVATYQQWYKVSGASFETKSPNNADPNPDKSIIAGYIRSGKYPNALPESVPEVFQSGYVATTEYQSDCGSALNPCASVSFVSGQGVVGQMVNANFYDNGNYSGGKYAPGKEIIVTVYDGIVGGSGNQQRTTIVGFARVTIFGYGNRLDGNKPNLVESDVSGPENTMYGYVESADDLKPKFSDFLMPGPAMLVQ